MQIRQRLELQQAHRDYLEMKARRLQAMKEEEEEFRRQVTISKMQMNTNVLCRCTCTYVYMYVQARWKHLVVGQTQRSH